MKTFNAYLLCIAATLISFSNVQAQEEVILITPEGKIESVLSTQESTKESQSSLTKKKEKLENGKLKADKKNFSTAKTNLSAKKSVKEGALARNEASKKISVQEGGQVNQKKMRSSNNEHTQNTVSSSVSVEKKNSNISFAAKGSQRVHRRHLSIAPRANSLPSPTSRGSVAPATPVTPATTTTVPVVPVTPAATATIPGAAPAVRNPGAPVPPPMPAATIPVPVVPVTPAATATIPGAAPAVRNPGAPVPPPMPAATTPVPVVPVTPAATATTPGAPAVRNPGAPVPPPMPATTTPTPAVPVTPAATATTPGAPAVRNPGAPVPPPMPATTTPTPAVPVTPAATIPAPATPVTPATTTTASVTPRPAEAIEDRNVFRRMLEGLFASGRPQPPARVLQPSAAEDTRAAPISVTLGDRDPAPHAVPGDPSGVPPSSDLPAARRGGPPPPPQMDGLATFNVRIPTAVAQPLPRAQPATEASSAERRPRLPERPAAQTSMMAQLAQRLAQLNAAPAPPLAEQPTSAVAPADTPSTVAPVPTPVERTGVQPVPVVNTAPAITPSITTTTPQATSVTAAGPTAADTPAVRRGPPPPPTMLPGAAPAVRNPGAPVSPPPATTTPAPAMPVTPAATATTPGAVPTPTPAANTQRAQPRQVAAVQPFDRDALLQSIRGGGAALRHVTPAASRQQPLASAGDFAQGLSGRISLPDQEVSNDSDSDDDDWEDDVPLTTPPSSAPAASTVAPRLASPGAQPRPVAPTISVAPSPSVPTGAPQTAATTTSRAAATTAPRPAATPQSVQPPLDSGLLQAIRGGAVLRRVTPATAPATVAPARAPVGFLVQALQGRRAALQDSDDEDEWSDEDSDTEDSDEDSDVDETSSDENPDDDAGQGIDVGQRNVNQEEAHEADEADLDPRRVLHESNQLGVYANTQQFTAEQFNQAAQNILQTSGIETQRNFASALRSILERQQTPQELARRLADLARQATEMGNMQVSVSQLAHQLNAVGLSVPRQILMEAQVYQAEDHLRNDQPFHQSAPQQREMFRVESPNFENDEALSSYVSPYISSILTTIGIRPSPDTNLISLIKTVRDQLSESQSTSPTSSETQKYQKALMQLRGIQASKRNWHGITAADRAYGRD